MEKKGKKKVLETHARSKDTSGSTPPLGQKLDPPGPKQRGLRKKPDPFAQGKGCSKKRENKLGKAPPGSLKREKRNKLIQAKEGKKPRRQTKFPNISKKPHQTQEELGENKSSRKKIFPRANKPVSTRKLKKNRGGMVNKTKNSRKKNGPVSSAPQDKPLAEKFTRHPFWRYHKKAGFLSDYKRGLTSLGESRLKMGGGRGSCLKP